MAEIKLPEFITVLKTKDYRSIKDFVDKYADHIADELTWDSEARELFQDFNRFLELEPEQGEFEEYVDEILECIPKSMDNETIKEIADEMVSDAERYIGQSKNWHDYYMDRKISFEEYAEVGIGLIAITSADLDKIRETFPDMIIGGIKQGE